jgi:FkbM family methyltransferase
MKNISIQARMDWINKGSDIREQLLEVFPADAPICVADIGACEGLSSMVYARIFPNAQFHLFEPRSDNVALIRENIGEVAPNASNFEVHHVALGAEASTRPFWESYGTVLGIRDWNVGNKSSSLLRPQEHLTEHAWCKFRQSVAEVRTLDSFGIPFEFIHIDVQGAEMEVFRGAEETLKSVKVVYTEVANIHLYENQPLANDISLFLSGKGFRLVGSTADNLKWGDHLYVR